MSHSYASENTRQRPWVIAHRGNSALAPENTMAAFTAAAIAGVDMIEIDIHPGAQGEAIVIHDASVDRTTNGSGLVSDLDVTELRRLDAGAWFSPYYAGQQVPVLADVLALAHRYPKVQWLIELKGVWSGDDVTHLREQLTTSALTTSTLTTSTFAGAAPTNSVVLQAFEVETMKALAQILPDYRRGLLVGPVEDSTAELARSLGATSINPALPYVAAYPDRVPELREAGFDVMVWTANEYTDWDVLVAAGVSGIITDRPDRLMGYLARA